MARPKAIMPISVKDNFVKMLIYGKPGVGKTQFACTAPRALVITHNRSEVISGALNGSKGHQAEIHTWDEADEIYQYLRHEGTDTYEWVWLDNGTLIQDGFMDQLMLTVAGKPTSSGGVRNQFLPDKPEYLQVQNQIGTLIRYLVALPIHVGVIAHVMYGSDTEGDSGYMPAFQGGKGTLSQKICGYMTTIGYMHVHEGVVERNGKKYRDVQRRILLDSRDDYIAKDRFSGAKELIDPTIPQYMALAAKRVPTLGAKGQPARKVSGVSKTAAKKAAGVTKKTTISRRTA